ncbi:WD repeat-containing protein 44-like isoform X2 [Dreissena polymorpha]|uniref:WD repeat-containing protein 44-like isoform X2 n=1 Tax=Dreissena polymorpha TaxID=45954 RepID=UPI002264CCAE|nr:WD repeat-containing protein 44-like isoform X2 [Dreissena polymorpha]
MSSDSELEEFFDAEDLTPKRVLLSRTSPRLDSLDELEREELALLELRRQQEERRRKEDSELQRRLEALNVKKKEKTVDRPEEKKTGDNEKRRRRHEELRKKMTDPGSSSETSSQDSFSEDENSDLEDENLIQSQYGKDSVNTNNNGCFGSSTPLGQASIEQLDKFCDISHNMNDAYPEKIKVSKQLQDLIAEKSRTGSLDNNHIDPEDVVENVLQESMLLCDDEPDIVRSTKTRTPLSTLQGLPCVPSVSPPSPVKPGNTADPVAPPRLKKKLKLSTDRFDSASSSVASESDCMAGTPSVVPGLDPQSPGLPQSSMMDPQSPGLPPEYLLPEYQLDRLKADIEQTLDLRALMRGKRHVKTQEAEALAVNSDHESPCHFLKVSNRDGVKSASLDRASKTSSLEGSAKSSSLEQSAKTSSLERSAKTSSLEGSSKTSNLDGSAKTSSLEGSAKTSSLEGSAKTSSLERSAKTSSPEGSAKTSSLEGSAKTSSLEGSAKTSSLERSAKTSSLEGSKKSSRDHSSKTSSMESDVTDGKGSCKSSSMDRHSKSSSLDKSERRRSRNVSGSELARKSSLSRQRASPTKPLTDEEVLNAVMVKNLDTGELVPLIEADRRLPKCIDPLVLHIMERTNELHSGGRSDDDTKSESGRSSVSEGGLRKKGARLKRLFGKKVGKTVSKVKSVADQVMHNEENNTIVEGEVSDDGRKYKFKANHNKKGPYDFGQLKFVQDLSGEHTGAVWCMKFSPCGRLLATGGQDSVLRIWVLDSCFHYFDDMRQKYIEMKVSPAASQESLSSIPSVSSEMSSVDVGACADGEEDNKGPFKSKPFCKYRGHTADLLDVTWSKNYFILSSSMDKTVRLWHISRRECLCTFQHMDFVTAIVFHPRDDRYFLSGSLDGKLRLWNIPDKKVTMWNEVENNSLITTANFCHNGKFAVVGTYDGKCIFYSTEHLKYYTQIHVRSTRGKNSKGKKITGIEPLPGEDKVLVTSNDSRVRLYDLRDLTLSCKYKGLTNTSSQIRATFSQRGKYLVCGSEDHFIYLFRTQHEFYKFSSARRDRNDYFEAFKVHNAVVTAAVFAPSPLNFLPPDESSQGSSRRLKDSTLEALPTSAPSLSSMGVKETSAEFIISADMLGCIKVVRAR